MLEFDTYRDILDDLEEEIKALNKSIQYRRIQLIGIRDIPNPFSVIMTLNACANQQNTISSEEQKILDNDLELQRMKERKKRLEDRRAFIYKTAELPEEDMAETDVFK